MKRDTKILGDIDGQNFVTGANSYLEYQVVGRCLNDHIPVIAVTSNVDSAIKKYRLDKRVYFQQ